MEILRYNNYHKHTHYSNIRTLDVIVKPDDYIQRAKELGHNTYFTTEHGFQGNIFEAQTLCDANDIKCIYGVEAYYVDDVSNKEDRSNYHICLIAMNENGRKELNYILSLANTEGFYYKPRIDRNMLLSLTPSDTIVTTACIASRMFKPGWEEEFLIPVYNHFKDNFYLEIQNHNTDKQKEHNVKLLQVSDKYGIKLIHGNDSHYINKEDSKYRDLFLKAKGIIYEDESDFVLDYPDSDTILERYKIQGVVPENLAKEALENTLVFDNAEPIKIDKEFKIPKVTEGDSYKILEETVYKAWAKEKYCIDSGKWKKYEEAIDYELDIIKNCGMSDYFLLDHEIVKKAVNEYNAVLTRSGRGSAVSFYINKLLGLTEVDRISAPITLYPTRFMSAERILSSRSIPDIDLNFADVDPVIKASKDILGEDGIYYMVAYKPLQESSAFRLWCKAQDMNIDDYNEIAKDLEKYENDSKWSSIIEDSKVFRGVIESIAPSPCSFLLSNKPISKEIGLIKVGDIICCALDGYNCDVYKFLKNDYLTVTVYKIIDEVYKLIDRPIDNIEQLINNCDDKVWEVYSNALTTTINQSDSDFGKQTLRKYKPKSLAELSAWVAAIRPGFSSLLQNFLERKPYSTGVKALDDILEDSFHYLLYQESIMKYLVWLGVEEKGTYDIIKKIAKKKFKEEELKELRTRLLDGWIKRVGKEDGFNETWQVVMDAAHYSFNASHSLSVAIDSMYGAYLKSHYPLEYFVTVLNLYSDDQDRTANLTDELKFFNIKLSDIKFGKSRSNYSMDKETNTIFKGIGSIKYLNDIVAEELYELSKNKFDNFADLLMAIKNTSCNSRQIDILIKLDYFSDFGNSKFLTKMVEILDMFKWGAAKQIKKTNINDEFLKSIISRNSKHTESLYKDINCQEIIKELYEYYKAIITEDYSVKDKMAWQEEYIGYIDLKSQNPDDRFRLLVRTVKALKTKDKSKIWAYGLSCVSLYTGKSNELIVYQRNFDKNPISEKSIILISPNCLTKKVYNEHINWYLSNYEICA